MLSLFLCSIVLSKFAMQMTECDSESGEWTEYRTTEWSEQRKEMVLLLVDLFNGDC